MNFREMFTIKKKEKEVSVGQKEGLKSNIETSIGDLWQVLIKNPQMCVQKLMEDQHLKKDFITFCKATGVIAGAYAFNYSLTAEEMSHALQGLVASSGLLTTGVCLANMEQVNLPETLVKFIAGDEYKENNLQGVAK